MIVRLIKRNRKSIDIVYLEVKDKFLTNIEGKINTKGALSVSNCGSYELAVKDLEKQVLEYQNKGYQIAVESDEIIDYHVFDKASWHYNGDFPSELDKYQGYVVIGFYIGWLIDNNLISEDFKQKKNEAILKFKNREITSVQFFKNNKNGVFASDILNMKGFHFTQYYYDKENSLIINDYDNLLGQNLETLYHIEDTWDNFYKLSNKITERFQEFHKNKL